jgi:diguanylate cyclase (GGDEF)-like protein
MASATSEEGKSLAWVVTQLARTLTRPLPEHIARFRESARTLLIFVALAITLATLWLPQPGSVDRLGVLNLAAVVAGTGLLSLVPSLHTIFNRVGGLVIYGEIVALVWLTGGGASPYMPLFVMLLVYAALFYDTGRLLATAALVVGAVLGLPLASGGWSLSYLAGVGVFMPIWLATAAAVHWLVRQARRSSQTDGLTGLLNSETFWALLRSEQAREGRYGGEYSLILLDVDHFKHVNDTYGHPVGDDVLRGIARILRDRARESDTVARFGGEEFMLLLPATDRDQALALADRLRVLVAESDFVNSVTISLGVASSGDGFATTPEEVVATADRALYGAKNAGRNRVAVALPEPAAAS